MKFYSSYVFCTGLLLLLSACSDSALDPEIAASNLKFVTVSPGSITFFPTPTAPKERTITIDYSFEVSTYEITQEEFLSLLGVNPSWHTGGLYPNWEKRPVEHVTWYDAVLFCNRLSELRGLEPAYEINHLQGNLEVGYYDGSVQLKTNADGYRLPTVNEWEYACRAGTTTQFYTGNLEDKGLDCAISEPIAERAGWYCTNSRSSSLPNGESKQVGLKEPNSFGLYDMHGNVWEWCQQANTVKGGSWANEPYYARSSSSVSEVWASGCDGGSRYFNVGFRIVRTIP